MRAPKLDTSDPAGRAHLTVHTFARRQLIGRLASALTLFALAGLGPALVSHGGEHRPMFGAILASLLLLGCGVAVWPWRWSDAERRHHADAAIWAQARPTADPEVPWTRYAAWATASDEHVELILISRAGTADDDAQPSPFAKTVKQHLDPDAVDEAAVAMEALREEAAELEARAQERHLALVAAAAHEPSDPALPAADQAADPHQRRAEIEMRRELAEEQAAERRAQAAAVARALRRR